eukprot:TRINITY_DN2653_c2_g1_i2.p1 TRINITY_DN2653_c2_g1~~TRINITY_DN2653_c2_g1_i2.p1  ORF type:complete len:886 (+),score=176.72 TRINITY_DN2653_c2_g1_i2:46-2658(+)
MQLKRTLTYGNLHGSGTHLNRAARALGPDDVGRFDAVFRLADSDEDGLLSLQELSSVLRRLGRFVSDAELAELLSMDCALARRNEASADAPDATVDFHGFLNVVSTLHEVHHVRLVTAEQAEDFHGSVKVMPDDWRVSIWEMCLAALIQYYTLVTLLHMLSVTNIHSLPLECVGSLAFALDVLLQCRVQQYNMDGSEDNATFRKSARMRSELVAAVPVDLVLISAGVGCGVGLLPARLPRLLKFCRVPSMFTMSPNRNRISPTFVRFHCGFIPVFLLTFWAATGLQCLVAVWCALGDGRRYDVGLYFVAGTIATVGYGDTPPDASPFYHRGFASATALLAAISTGLITGKLVTYSHQADVTNENRTQQLETLAGLESLNLPSDFVQEVLGYQHHKAEWTSVASGCNDLPSQMQERLRLCARMRLLRGVRVELLGTSDLFVARLSLALVEAFMLPSENIFVEWEKCREACLIILGRVRETSADGCTNEVYCRGDVIGCGGLFSSVFHASTTQSDSYCTLYTMQEHDAREIAAAHPDEFQCSMIPKRDVAVISTRPRRSTVDCSPARRKASSTDLLLKDLQARRGERKESRHSSACSGADEVQSVNILRYVGELMNEDAAPQPPPNALAPPRPMLKRVSRKESLIRRRSTALSLSLRRRSTMLGASTPAPALDIQELAATWSAEVAAGVAKFSAMQQVLTDRLNAVGKTLLQVGLAGAGAAGKSEDPVAALRAQLPTRAPQAPRVRKRGATVRRTSIPEIARPPPLAVERLATGLEPTRSMRSAGVFPGLSNGTATRTGGEPTEGAESASDSLLSTGPPSRASATPRVATLLPKFTEPDPLTPSALPLDTLLMSSSSVGRQLLEASAADSSP